VSGVSIAKTIRLAVDAPSEDAARAQVVEMCERLLANPVIERYTVTFVSERPRGGYPDSQRASDRAGT
jgi:phosphoribosylformylglycinamidine synthase subunit PurS